MPATDVVFKFEKVVGGAVQSCSACSDGDVEVRASQSTRARVMLSPVKFIVVALMPVAMPIAPTASIVQLLNVPLVVLSTTESTS